jgi:diguanylate cyclase (GGDEF)-like protein/PAS domain S-box-containing protein
MIRVIAIMGLLACVWGTAPRAETGDADALADKRVLLVYSYHPSFLTSARILQGIRSVFGGTGLTLDIDYMDSKRLLDEHSLANYRSMLSYKLSKRAPYDLVMVSDDNALSFLLANRDGLFPRTPIVFLGVNNVEKAIAMDTHPYVTGVIEAVSLKQTIRLARSLHPILEQIVVAVDATPSGKADLANLQPLTPAFKGLEFTTLSMAELSWEELAQRVRGLDKRSVILPLALFRDKNGVVISKIDSFELLLENSPFPVYGLRETDMPAGAFGGVVVNFYEQGRQAALIAERVLTGTPISSIEVVKHSPNRPMFDYASLQRFHISEADLPPESIILNKPTGFFSRYAWLVAITSALITVLVGFIVYLWWQISARQRAEKRLRESEQRFRNMVEGSVQGVLIHRHQKPIFANQAYADILGYGTREAILALDSVQQTYASHEHERLRAYQTARREGQAAPSQYEFDAIRKDGSRVRLLTVVRATTWDGEFVTQHNIMDITGRKRAEEALRMSQTRFRDFAETAADWFWETDAAFRIGFLSNRYEDATSVSPDEVLGRTAEELYSKETDDEERWQRQRQDLENHRPFRDHEYRLRLADGTRRVHRISGTPFFDNNGDFKGYRGTGRDVTEAHALSEQLSYQASHDALTGLLNRRAFERRLQQIVDQVRTDDSQHAVCYLDLDLFKGINDTCGHMAGDELLRQLGELLPASLRKSDMVVRLGGDEFGVLIEHCSLAKAEEVAQAIRQTIEDIRFQWEDKRFNIGVSIGLVPVTSASGGVDEILSAADTACYAAKQEGRNRVHVYTGANAETANRYGDVQWATRIQQALDQDLFRLSYQPISPVKASAHRGLHYELLLRMEDEDGQLVLPSAFMPAAERYNLSTKIDRWVVNTAFRWLTDRPAHLAQLYLCSINLSALSLGDQGFLDFVLGMFRTTNVPPEKICFEVTETAAISNFASAARFIKSLKECRCRIALDDFGSGLSSFGYLKNLPADFLKIDGMFVKDIADDPIDLAMVKSIIEISQVMNKQTIAEFVEDDRILEKLRDIGVDFAQGYAIGRPQPMERMITNMVA